ncbi:YkvA family protein [Botryobacter ruber]|uniref:YkvA family protein n=1 Tax=Botryobacter ruber TaxID=2171629 RepID=UPI000E0C6113|nr:DUF1232 domain-containing protein [Botryobacter ruber]
MTQLHILKQKTHELNTEIYALYLSFRDKRVAWPVRLLLAFMIGYGISPIDLVPDLTPVFGFLDDIVLVTVGLSMAYRLVAKNILDESRMHAYEVLHTDGEKEANRIVLFAWMLAAALAAILLYKLLFLDAL